MEKNFKKSAKILMPLVLACLLALGVSAAAPGFSNGEVSQTVNTGAAAEAIVSAITADTAVVESVSSVIAEVLAANDGASASEVIANTVAAIAADGGEVADIAAEIVVAALAEVEGADVISTIVDVVSAITNVSDANVSEVLAAIVASIPPEVLADLTVEFVTEQGVGLDIPATTFLSTLVEHGITDLTFAANTVSAESAAYNAAVSAAQESANDLGAPIEIAEVLDLNLLDQNNNAISNLGGEVTVSLPVKGSSNAGAYFNELKGRLEVLPSRVRNGFIEFKTTHFSYYVLIEAPASVVPDFSTVLTPNTENTVVTPPAVVAPPVEPATSPAPVNQNEAAPVQPIPESAESGVSEPVTISFLDDTADANEPLILADANEADNAPAEPVKKNPRTGSAVLFVSLALTVTAGTAVFFVIKRKRADSF